MEPRGTPAALTDRSFGIEHSPTTEDKGITMKTNRKSLLLTMTLAASLTAVPAGASFAEDAFLPAAINSSTIPANGDVNPYGVAFVPSGFPSGGSIGAGDVLVANFNDSDNVQGTGTTIVRLPERGPLAPPGAAETFFTSKLVGLSTALGVLRGGFVVVGNVSTKDGSFATIGRGALQIIDRHGKLIATWTDPVFLDGPWDLTIDDHGGYARIFVANVLSGTVSRLDVAVGSSSVTLQSITTVASGYSHVPNAGAVVLGPTGLAYDAAHDTLYVASTNDNAIYAVSDARARSAPAHKGTLVFASEHLRGPLALRFAPNGNLLAANGDAVNADLLHPSEIVEFTSTGDFVREYNVDASQGGAFGLDTRTNDDDSPNFAVIDDVTNNLLVIRLPGH
jgi:DNA-binding beta-propeller fold protein YncE